MEQVVKQKKDPYVNVLKGIACIIVIFLHCPLPGVIGDAIIYGVRFSVPVFFLISGYYSYSKSNKWIFEKAIYILKLLFFSEVFYGIWFIIKEFLICQREIQDVIYMAIMSKNIFKVILCGTMFNGTLWYLYAIFWTWILVYLLRKCKLIRNSYILIPLLLVLQIFGRVYVQNYYDINEWVFLFRNALTFGLPFTLLGIWIAENRDSLLEKIDVFGNAFLIIGGFLLVIVEFLVLGQYMDVHISTVIISVGLFLYAIRLKEIKWGWLRIFEWIGIRWYTWVYIFHMFFVELLEIVYRWFEIENRLFLFIKPFLVVILASILAELIMRKTNGKRNAVN